MFVYLAHNDESVYRLVLHTLCSALSFSLCENTNILDTNREGYIEGFCRTLCLQLSTYELPCVTTAACTHQL